MKIEFVPVCVPVPENRFSGTGTHTGTNQISKLNRYIVLQDLFPLFSLNGFLFIIFIFARVVGFFFIAPLLSHRAFFLGTRLFFMMFLTLLIGMTLYPQYFGPTSKLSPNVLEPAKEGKFLLIGIRVLKEVAIGYLIGICFALFFEAVSFAGEIVDRMANFATAQYIDPVFNQFQSLTAQLFTLFAGLLIFSLDLHLLLIKLIANSFSLIPLSQLHSAPSVLEGMTLASSDVFTYGLKLAAFPFVVLALQTVGVGFVVRVVPELNLLLTGVPMRILVGFYSLMLAMSHIPSILQMTFMRFEHLAEWIIYYQGHGT